MKTDQWLFFQNVIQAHPHGGKTPIVLYQEMWMRRRRHVGILLSAVTSQVFNLSGPPPVTRNFVKKHQGHTKICPEKNLFSAQIFHSENFSCSRGGPYHLNRCEVATDDSIYSKNQNKNKFNVKEINIVEKEKPNVWKETKFIVDQKVKGEEV